MAMYESIFQIIKNRIESGLLEEGTALPSRADLSQEFGTSEKTIRHALALLEKNGFIETEQRKRPVVRRPHDGHRATLSALKRIDAGLTSDRIKAGVLLCYPLIKNGISLCTQRDLEVPRQILEIMKDADAFTFWKLSKKFLRFFVARNENVLILRIVDSLGLSDLNPLYDNPQIRTRYWQQLQALLQAIEIGGDLEALVFDDLSEIYGVVDGGIPAFRAISDCPILPDRTQLEQSLDNNDVQYSAVYMDILGLIDAGQYRKKDQLPPHKELQKQYGVSVNTTVRAIQILQSWGVVKAVRGQGIFVEMDRKEIEAITIEPRLIACHVRRYLDTLECLSLTMEGIAASAAEAMDEASIAALQAEVNRLWTTDYLYERTPALLLDFIISHVHNETLDLIYSLLQRNFKIGRSLPGLLNTEKNELNVSVHEQCLEVIETLAGGDPLAFAEKCAALFERIYRLVIEACRQLGYYEAAATIYDGRSLWK